ncbi:MAG: hypothetical protein IME93_03280 [Proteobacteria bacterium]|nr:hypothetical protein [Pseudomonadota bacterium]
MIETGRRGCGGSPYDDYSFESDKANAKKELDFLVTLLPEGEVCKVEGWGYYWVMK